MGKQAYPLEEPRVNIPAKAPMSVRRAIEAIAAEDDRSFSNMVSRLLEESPRVKRKMRELESVEQAA